MRNNESHIVNWQVKNLCKEHKPDVDAEKQRITSLGGEIYKCVPDPNEPLRVWVRF